MQLVDRRIEAGRAVEIDVAPLRGFRLSPDADIVQVQKPLQPYEFSAEQIEQALDLVVKRKEMRHRVHENENALDHLPPQRRIGEHVRPLITQIAGYARHHIVRLDVLVADDG